MGKILYRCITLNCKIRTCHSDAGCFPGISTSIKESVFVALSSLTMLQQTAKAIVYSRQLQMWMMWKPFLFAKSFTRRFQCKDEIEYGERSAVVLFTICWGRRSAVHRYIIIPAMSQSRLFCRQLVLTDCKQESANKRSQPKY